VKEIVHDIPVKVVNVPAGMSNPRLAQKSIPYHVEGKVFDLLIFRNTAKVVELDLRYYDLDKKSIPWEYFRLSLSKRLDNLTISPFEPVDFYIESDMLVSRNIPIKIIFSNEKAKSMFTENGYNFVPKLVEITGAESVLDRIQRIETEPITYEQLTNDTETIKLIPPSEKVIITTKFISIDKPEQSVVSKTFSLVPIRTEEKLKSIPRWASVRIVGPKQIIDTLKVADIHIKPDSLTNSDGSRFLDIQLPKEIKLLDYNPEKVNLIETK
jgi:YbbR domain-containing protein